MITETQDMKKKTISMYAKGMTTIDIKTVYPKTKITQYIIHQIRNTTQYVSYKVPKKLMADLKMVYAVYDEATALERLESFVEKYNNKYPKIYKSWYKR